MINSSVRRLIPISFFDILTPQKMMSETENIMVGPSEEKNSMLRTEGLVKRYGKRTVANGVSINVRQGEIVGLLGPNGAGSATLPTNEARGKDATKQR